MNEQEALDYVDLIVEKLREWGIIDENQYGHMTTDQREELASLVSDKSKE